MDCKISYLEKSPFAFYSDSTGITTQVKVPSVGLKVEALVTDLYKHIGQTHSGKTE